MASMTLLVSSEHSTPGAGSQATAATLDPIAGESYILWVSCFRGGSANPDSVTIDDWAGAAWTDITSESGLLWGNSGTVRRRTQCFVVTAANSTPNQAITVNYTNTPEIVSFRGLQLGITAPGIYVVGSGKRTAAAATASSGLNEPHTANAVAHANDRVVVFAIGNTNPATFRAELDADVGGDADWTTLGSLGSNTTRTRKACMGWIDSTADNTPGININDTPTWFCTILEIDYRLGGTATPAAVALTATTPAPTATGAATTSPAAVALTVTTPAPTAEGGSGGGDGTATPSAVALTVTTPAPTVSGASNIEPAAVTLTATTPAPTVTGGGTTTPTTVALTITATTPTATGGAATSPSAVTLTVVAAAATVTGGGTTSPPAVALTVTTPAPSASSGSSATPSAVELTATTPASSATGDAATAPSAVTLSATTPAPTVTGGGTSTPAAVATTVTVPVPTGTGDAATTPTPVTLTVTVTDPTVTGGGTARPVTLELTFTAHPIDLDEPGTVVITVTSPGATLAVTSATAELAVTTATATLAVTEATANLTVTAATATITVSED